MNFTVSVFIWEMVSLWKQRAVHKLRDMKCQGKQSRLIVSFFKIGKVVLEMILLSAKKDYHLSIGIK